jgi:DNA-binding CsgD family transcriptional regulator
MEMAEISRGWDLFRVGAYAEAEELLLPFTHDAQAVRILLWIAIRRGDDERKRECGAWLAVHADESLAAVGRAHENVARAAQQSDLAPWLTPVSRWSKAEVAYARALIAYIEDRPGDVRAALSQALPHTAEQRVRYAQLRAWVKALGEDFEAQAIGLAHALHLAIHHEIDAGHMAIIAEPLAALVREVELGDIGVHAEELLEQVRWPQDETVYRFHTQRALAWRKSLRGNWIQAIHLLDTALPLAPDAMRRGLIHADRARICATISEPVTAMSSRAFAFQYFFETDWANAKRDEALGIFGAMDVLRDETDRATELFRQAARIQPSRMSGVTHGRHFKAFENFALSQLTTGSQALGHAAEAYKIFKAMKYRDRAASCALRAVEIGAGERWRQRLERLVSGYPRSLVANQYRISSSPVNSLRGRMREIGEMLAVTDKSVREIGQNLGIAENTVRVHVRRLYKTVGVESRTQLVRAFIESGYDVNENERMHATGA